MGSLRFAELQTRPTEVLDLTTLTVDEFRQLVPPFEASFQPHMGEWRLDGRLRTARQYATYKNCPLPTPEDRLLFILIYLKTYPLQTSALCSVVIENVHTLDTHFPTHSHWRGLRLGGVTTVWLSSVCGSWSCVA